MNVKFSEERNFRSIKFENTNGSSLYNVTINVPSQEGTIFLQVISSDDEGRQAEEIFEIAYTNGVAVDLSRLIVGVVGLVIIGVVGYFVGPKLVALIRKRP